MTRKIRDATYVHRTHLDRAVELMRAARQQIGFADAPKAKEALNAALKSAEGAQRHMERRLRQSAAGTRGDISSEAEEPS